MSCEPQFLRFDASLPSSENNALRLNIAEF